MKKNFFQIVMGALALSLGLSACKKDKNCVQCATFTDEDGTYTYCVGDGDIKTEAEFKAAVAELKADGYAVKYSEKCDN